MNGLYTNWLVLQAAYYYLTEKKCSNNFSKVDCKVSNLKNRIAGKRGQSANLILATLPKCINCPFSRPSKIRLSFCPNYSKIGKFWYCKCFFIFKICQTVARHKYDQSISQKIFCCLSLTNYLISKLWLPFLRVIFAIV